MSINIGCIGCGNMGGAILGGLAKSGKGYVLCGNTRTMKRMDPLVKLGVEPLDSAADVARKSRYVVLAVKPYQVEDVLSGMRGALSADNVLISIAAGVSLDTLKKFSGGVCPVVRCMPNTPALVAKGVFAFSFEDPRLADGQKREILDIFQSSVSASKCRKAGLRPSPLSSGLVPPTSLILWKGWCRPALPSDSSTRTAGAWLPRSSKDVGAWPLKTARPISWLCGTMSALPRVRLLSASTAWMRMASPGNLPRLSSRPTAAA